MAKQAQNRPRGRPLSTQEGALEAYDFVEAFRQKQGLSRHALALTFHLTPTTVARALKGERAKIRLRPGLEDLYRRALNWTDATTGEPTASPSSHPVAQRAKVDQLASYSGPGQAAVRRILADVAELISTLRSADQT